MNHVTRSCTATKVLRTQMRRPAWYAATIALCASCSSDDDNTSTPSNAAGTSGMIAGGTAAAGSTNSPTTGGTAGRSSTLATAGTPATAGGPTAFAGQPSSLANAGVAGKGSVTTAGAASAGTPGTAGATSNPLRLYVGCADTNGSVMHYTLDRTTGAVSPVNTYTTGVSNSWATLNAAQNRMYVNSRTTGRITTLERNPTTGELKVLSNVEVPMAPIGAAGAPGAAGAQGSAGSPLVAGAPNQGGAPSSAGTSSAGAPNIAGSPGSAGTAGTTSAAGATSAPPTNPSTQVIVLDSSEKYLLAANYSANYVYVYSVLADGTVGPMVAWQVDGVSSHQVVFAPGNTNGLALVPYRGSDTIATYQFNPTSGALALKQIYLSDTDNKDATTGPRHLVFHPSHDNWVYVVNEVAGSISLLDFDKTAGTLMLKQTQSSVPTDYTAADKFASEIAIAPNGNFVYVSNRYSTSGSFTTEGSLGVFAVNPTNGQLTPVQFQGSRGALPRHFELSRDGSVLVVGNQNSNNIAVFSVNQATGALTLQRTEEVCTTPFFVKLVGG